MTGERLEDLKRFYDLLGLLRERTGGPWLLSGADDRRLWPRRGVYFFMEEGEQRRESGAGPRIVRVGTHALKPGSQTTLWKRLSQHRGQVRSGGGNHRGSIFRLIVGTAVMARDELDCPSWDNRQGNADRSTRNAELAHEQLVSGVIRAMPFLWLPVEDEPGPDSLRGLIERGAIALLSNYQRPALDPPSSGWLGHHCNRPRVRESGLWNSNHVDETYDLGFLDLLEQLVRDAGGRT